jgi:hypothetical protein
MPVADLPTDLVGYLTTALLGATPRNIRYLTKRGLLPERVKFAWNPDLCLVQGECGYLVHAVAPSDEPDWSPEIPTWVTKPFASIKDSYRKTKLLILVRGSKAGTTWKVAGKLAEQCAALGAGLAFEVSQGLCVALPPGFVMPRKPRSASEGGHVPSWVLDRIILCKGFSPYLAKCFARFERVYRREAVSAAPSYDHEADLLFKFAKEVARGDQRLFLPIDRLHELKEWERRRGPARSRDHFFHTFNNLLLGYLLLGMTLIDRPRSAVPDRYIGGEAKLAPWEVLWLLTCLLHDRGYIAEKFWSTLSVTHAFTDQLPDDQPVPESVARALNDAWETQFREARTDLRDLYEKLTGSWSPGRFKKETGDRFEEALRKAYFDGKRASHSLHSGLDLITTCNSDKTAKRSMYNPKKALAACEIAALSMMFHDQHCRQILREGGILPLAFEDLPFAATLMFVDAIQDDRRDVTKSTFQRRGVLEDLTITMINGIASVRATVCLPLVELQYWPAKIQEYEDVMKWLNTASRARFSIDYKTRSWNLTR